MISVRLLELGIELPPPFPPAGNYLACVIDEGLVHVGAGGTHAVRWEWLNCRST